MSLKIKHRILFFSMPVLRIVTFFLLLSLGNIYCIAFAEKEEAMSTLAESKVKKIHREYLDKIVIDKLEFYSSQYPDISFVVFDSAANVDRNMQLLSQVIGQNPIPLDYEHPDDLRKKLLLATLKRIEFLLSMNAGSSTLFKSGKGAMAKRQYVCIVTIDPWATAKDNRTATYDLLDFEDSELTAISPADYLDYVSHLRFTLDHEVYHCLDSLYNGPIPMSQLAYWGSYHMRKNELGADAFATIMNIGDHGGVIPYMQTLRNIRGLTLLTDDPNHYSYQAIGAALKMEPEELVQSNVRERFNYATSICERVVGTYDEHVRYTNAAYYATKQLGRQAEATGLSKENLDYDQVRTLVMETRNAYYNLTGREIPPARFDEILD